MIILPKNDQDIDGIISFLFWHGSSLSRYIETYETSVYDQYWNYSSVIVDQLNAENKTNANWCSKNQAGSFVQVSFKKHYIRPYSYAFRSRTLKHWDMPTDWIAYGSIDNKTWSQIDNITNEKRIFELNSTANFKPKVNGIYKHFKFLLTKNSNSIYVFCLNRLDIFGEIYNERSTNNCNKQKYGISRMNLFFMIQLRN